MSEDFFDMPKETREKISKSQIGNKYGWKPALDKPYAEAKELVAKGVAVTCACAAVGITTDQYYRRKRIETQGKDRREI